MAADRVINLIQSVELMVEILVEFCHTTFVFLLGLSGCVGLLALVSPRALAAVASHGNRVIYQVVESRFDKRLGEIDRFVLGHGRPFGLIVVATVGYLWLISSYGPQSYTNSFLLMIVAIAMGMGSVALWHIKRQSKEIAAHRADAHTDPLTGLANRRLFETDVSRRLAECQRLKTPLSLLVVDVDKFKSFNDEFGHLLGDALLKEVARTLVASVRQMDIVSRFGGDEFVVLLPGCDLEDASQAAERLRSVIDDHSLRFEGREHALTISIGLTEAQLDDDVTSLLKRADSALYVAKDAGRNCCSADDIAEPACLVGV